MGQTQVNITSLEGARAAGKSVIKNSHDTQMGGVKQVLKQNVQNTKVSDSASSNAHSDGSISGCGFAQRKTGSKRY